MKVNWKIFCEWLANNILTIVQLLAPTGYVIYRKVFANNTPLSMLEWILIAIVALELGIMIGKALWNRFSYKAYAYPWSKITSNYIIERKTIKYIMNEKEELLYSRSMTVKSRINPMDSIYDKYIWTGESEAELPRGVCGIRTIELDNVIGIWNYFRIIFDERIPKGDSRDIEYNWPPIANCTLSSAFFSVSTDEPTKKVELILNLGSKYAHRQIVLEEFRAIESDNAISVRTDALDEHGCFTWNVEKVKRFRYYRIRWSWQEPTVPNLHG